VALQEELWMNFREIVGSREPPLREEIIKFWGDLDANPAIFYFAAK